MNPAQRLQEAVQCLRYQTELSKPKYDFGMWLLDIRREQVWVVYQWSPELGHGVSLLTDDVGYGEGPEHVYQTLEEAVEKVADLFEMDDLDRYVLGRTIRDRKFSPNL